MIIGWWIVDLTQEHLIYKVYYVLFQVIIFSVDIFNDVRHSIWLWKQVYVKDDLHFFALSLEFYNNLIQLFQPTL